MPSPTPVAGRAPAPAPGPAAVEAPTDDHRVGRATVARIVESAIEQERKKKPKTTQFFQTLVDKEVRSQNRGLFVATIVLAVFLVGALGLVGWLFLRGKSESEKIEKQQAQIHKGKKARDRLAKEAAERDKRNKAQIEALKKAATKRETQLQAAITTLKKENAKIKKMAEDKGPMISQKNKATLYLLSHGAMGRPRYGVCTAFAVTKRLLATNAHCISVMRRYARTGSHFYVIQNENTSMTAKVISMRPHSSYRDGSFRLTPDVGLLRVDKDLPNLVELASTDQLREVKRGSLMFSFGFPGRLASVRRPVATLVHGRVGRLTKFDTSLGSFPENQLLQHSALSMGGASGSPLFNAQGQVIGIHAGSYASRSTQTLYDPQTRAARKVLTRSKLGYKFGIRIDTLKPLMTSTTGWENVATQGVFSAVTQVPADLQGVNCAALKTKMNRCAKSASLGRSMQRYCQISKKTPSPSSVKFLKFSKCYLGVKGCDRTQIRRCMGR